MAQTPPNMETSTSGYSDEAPALIARYESLRFEDVPGSVVHLFPPAPARVADIGAGTGRDAAALARLGYRVTAVEPTAELRNWGESAHAAAGIRWLDDLLPGLPALTALGEKFDLLLLTAVWMHLDEAERATAMQALAGLLAPGGRISMSLRHGPVPDGRRMFDVSGKETTQLAARYGLAQVASMARADMLANRPGVHWTFLLLEKPA